MQDLLGSQDFPSGPQQWVEKDAKGVAWCLFSFRFVLLGFFLAVKDLNCTGSWEMGGGRREDLRGPGGSKSQGRREAVTQTIGVPPSHALSVCLSLFCLV